MLGLGRVKRVVYLAIARHRRSAPVRFLHGAAAFVDEAYRNEGSDFNSNGEWEVLKKLARANFEVAFDVGANFGDWSHNALAAWPRCEIHAFEVAPETYRELVQHCSTVEGSGRLHLNNLGLSDQAGSQEMFYYPDHPDLTCDRPRHAGYTALRFDAQLTTGDRYCVERTIRKVDFLKIDVEGAEYRVLHGFSNQISERNIACIQFEYGAFATQTRFLLGDYYALLSGSYWIGKIYPGYVDFQDYSWQMEDFRFCNYLCVSRQRPDLKALLAG
jgi:FkbM family methyltransferase